MKGTSRFSAEHLVLLAGVGVVALPALTLLVPQGWPPAPQAQVTAPMAVAPPKVASQAPQPVTLPQFDVAKVVMNALSIPMSLGATPAAAMTVQQPAATAAAGATATPPQIAEDAPPPVPDAPPMLRRTVHLRVSPPAPAMAVPLGPDDIDLRMAVLQEPLAPTLPMQGDTADMSQPPGDPTAPLDLREALTSPTVLPAMASPLPSPAMADLGPGEDAMIDLRSAVLGDLGGWLSGSRGTISNVTTLLASENTAPDRQQPDSAPLINLASALTKRITY
ncbi:MAG: hypothetical protein GC186_16580 [Rhodobacteraceae bacterium]|nr:hypothetical protein [Paracoccaceae bacterium]